MKVEKRVRRFDLGEMREATRTPQGFLMVPGFATRVGVFPYLDGNGKVRRELRHPDDVFDPESMKTLKYVPVTIEHPPVMLDPKNVAEYSVGHTTERVDVNRDMLDTDLIVEHQDGIDAIEKENIRELSCGYDCKIIEEEGVYEGTPYDLRQTKIVYNHLAMVKRGRAGPEIRMRLDSADAVMQAEEVPLPLGAEFSQEGAVSDAEESGPQSKKVVILGREVDLPSDIADAVQDMLDRFDEMRAEVSQLKEQGMKTARKDNKDMDVRQPGISPQVNVAQPGPDGRKAPGKIGASDTGGAARAKGDAEHEEKKEDAEHDDADKGAEEQGGVHEVGKADEEKEDFETPAGAGPAMSPADKLKKELEEAEGLQKQHAAHVDSLRAKMDEMAAGSMNQGEAKPGGKMDSADVQKMIRRRARLEREAAAIVAPATVRKFDSMSDDEIRVAAIQARHPSFKGKDQSSDYLSARFDSVVEALEEQSAEDRRSAGRAFMEGDGARTDGAEEIDPDKARSRMVQSSREGYKTALSAVKK